MHSRMAIDFKEEILRWMGRTHVGIIVVRMSAATSGNFAGTVPGIAFALPGYGTTDLDAASRPDRASSARDAQKHPRNAPSTQKAAISLSHCHPIWPIRPPIRR